MNYGQLSENVKCDPSTHSRDFNSYYIQHLSCSYATCTWIMDTFLNSTILSTKKCYSILIFCIMLPFLISEWYNTCMCIILFQTFVILLKKGISTSLLHAHNVTQIHQKCVRSWLWTIIQTLAGLIFSDSELQAQITLVEKN